MTLTVQEGTWKGQPIRKARKPGRCDYFRGRGFGRCRNRIEVGAFYMEGEANNRAGGFGCDRYCMWCAGHEARRAAGVTTVCADPGIAAMVASGVPLEVAQ